MYQVNAAQFSKLGIQTYVLSENTQVIIMRETDQSLEQYPRSAQTHFVVYTIIHTPNRPSHMTSTNAFAEHL